MSDYTKDSIRQTNGPEPVRLNKYLSDAGICSRREADRLIGQGLVSIDGRIAVLGEKVSPDQTVLYRGRPVKPDNRLILIAFHKPEGVECTTSAEVPDNVVDYIHYPERIFPVGRLDKNSSGLLLLTNTGELSDKILRGSNYHEKEYFVRVDRPVTDSFLKEMAQGVRITLDDGKRSVRTRPCRIRKAGPDSFHIVLTQGLNRQIRRMCAAFGYQVESLKRIRIMNIVLGDLKEGSYRHLNNQEIADLIADL